jgi:hypothetical protein
MESRNRGHRTTNPIEAEARDIPRAPRPYAAAADAAHGGRVKASRSVVGGPAVERAAIRRCVDRRRNQRAPSPILIHLDGGGAAGRGVDV